MTGDGLEVRLMRFPLTEEAHYLLTKRDQAVLLLGQRWLLHPANAVRRVPPKPGVIESGLAAETVAWVESYADEAGTALTLICS